MNKNMIANQPLTYGTRRLLPGDGFTAPRRDADLLKRLGRASDAPQVSTNPKSEGDVAVLRKQYMDKFGKRPFHGWSAGELSEKIAEREI